MFDNSGRRNFVRRDFVRKDFVRRDFVRRDFTRRDFERRDIVRREFERLSREQNTPTYALGLDLGLSQDYTAVAVVERVELEDPSPGTDEFEYHLRFLTRFPLGTRNPDILNSVEEMLNRRPLKGRTRLVIDSTGIGMPIVNDFFARRLRPFPILITGAARTSFKRRTLCVPKRDLVANLTRLFERRLLKIPADIQLRDVLVQELTNFTMRITKNAHDTYSPLHHSQHDDLVIALALACYYLEWLRRKPRIKLRITGISRTVYP